MNTQILPVDRIHAGNNPRSSTSAVEDAELLASVVQDGVLEPVRVVPNESGYRIESGHRRFAAALAAGLTEIPATIVEDESDVDEYVRAIVTNVQRADMNPIDEARAFKTLMDKHGLTKSGVADRLGIPQSRVSLRLELLELPVKVIQLYYDLMLRLDCHKVFLALSKISEEFCELVAKTVAGKDEWGAQLAKDPMAACVYVARENPKKALVLPGQVLISRFGKLPKELQERIDKITPSWQKSDARVYFTEADVQAAEAAGVLFSHKDSDSYICTDIAWAKSQLDVIVARSEKEIAKRAKEDAAFKASQSKTNAADIPADEQAAEAAKEARRLENQARNDGKVSARAANLELGRKLLNELASIDVGKLTLPVARLLAFGLVSHDLDKLVLGGLRLCLPEFQTEEKVGAKKDRTKVVYLKGHDNARQKGHEWLTRAKTPGEVVGRALCLILMAAYADQGAVPQGERFAFSSPDLVDYTGKGKVVFGTDKMLTEIAKTAVPKELTAKVKPSQKPLVALQRKLAASAAKE